MAAATPMGALTALQALRDTAELSEGESVLVWGASGGVGHLAIQVARAIGARKVDGVCSTGNAAMVRSQGAEEVFDYTVADDITELLGGRRYDAILDLVSTTKLRHLKAALTEQGRVVTVGSTGGGRVLGPAAAVISRALAAPITRVRAKPMLAHTDAGDLAIAAGWLADGTLTPVIQERYPLAAASAACAVLEGGHVAGKLVITLA
jgi:NADPH:quinone reductase-like Zn-dependent oxidoreductase